MALLVTVDNKPVFVKPEVGELLWRVKTGEHPGNPTLQDKVKKIARFYLNRATAPQSYLNAYPEIDNPKKKNAPAQARLPYKDNDDL